MSNKKRLHIDVYLRDALKREAINNPAIPGRFLKISKAI